jgi:hypothetical protein
LDISGRSIYNSCNYQPLWKTSIYSPLMKNISAIRRGMGEKIVSDNGKCIRTYEECRGLIPS